MAQTEFKFREKLAKKQTKLLMKSDREHQKIVQNGTIAQERAWAKRDLALRAKLKKEFQRKVKRFKNK